MRFRKHDIHPFVAQMQRSEAFINSGLAYHRYVNRPLPNQLPTTAGGALDELQRNTSVSFPEAT
jgi:hypothetical protein